MKNFALLPFAWNRGATVLSAGRDAGCWLLVFGLMLLATSDSRAQLTTNAASYTVNSAVPDGDASGLSDTRTLAATGISSIQAVVVRLDLSGGFNGDLYAYLTHGPGFAVLLNRPGRTATDALGYPDSGFHVILDDAALNGDIHSYRLTTNPGGGVLSGNWAPDGRNVDPALAVDTSGRSALLASLRGLDANGSWTLFVADAAPGGVATLNAWGLEIVGVPEPYPAAVLACGAGVFLIFKRCRITPAGKKQSPSAEFVGEEWQIAT